MTFGSKNSNLMIYSDSKKENHFLRKLTSKSNFQIRLNIVNDYNCFWVVRGKKIRKSHDWVERIYNHFFVKDIFTYEILLSEDIKSYRRLAFYQERDINRKAVYIDNTTWEKLWNKNQKSIFLAMVENDPKNKAFNRAKK